VWAILAVTTLAPVAGDGQLESDAKMVDLNVVVVDARGQPVTDLTSDDFQVTDAGKPQSIVYFQHSDSRLQQPVASGPNEFSNRNAGTIPHVTLILFDQLNQRFGGRAIAANQMVKDLEKLESADDLYLYLLTVDGRFQAVHGFEEGGSERPGEPPWTRQIKSRLDEATRASLRVRPVDIDVAVREQLTFRALDAIGAQLSRFPGRKNIVWVTDGVPMELGPRRSDTGDFVDFTPQIRMLSEVLDRSHVAIYPVRQVMLGSPDAIDGGTGVTSLETLNDFAGMTGGRTDGGKDIGTAVQQAISDVRTSYQIGYFPPEKNWDGKFHKIRVTSKRKGVRIQTRTGYYAWQEAPGQRAQVAIDSVLANPFDAGEIGLRATMGADPQQPGGKRVAIHIDGGDVALTQEGRQYYGRLRVVIADYRTEGLVENARMFAVEPHYTPQEHDKAVQDGIDVSQDFKPGDQARRIRVVVFDRNSNSVGSVTILMGVPEETRR